MKDSNFWIEKLGLISHTEGGYFKEIYRSHDYIDKDSLPERFSGSRAFATSIYYLITSNEPSKFHKVMADELWHFIHGSSIKMHMFDENGNYSFILLGLNIDKGEQPTIVVPHQTWMAAEVIENNSFCLVACTTSPGFEYDDFIMAKRERLIELSPDNKSVIEKFT